jgi:hypothetical protein
MANKISNAERYVAATAYLFDLGYAMSFLAKKDSGFTKYHFEQENRIITRVLLPGLALLLIGIFWVSSISKIFIYLVLLVVLISLVLSLIASIYALKGQMKKIL